MSSEVLKEFLVSLSFSKDEAGFHRTMEAVEGLTKKMVVLGGAIEAAAIASVAAMHRIAMGMEAVGYASSRIGASVSGIKEFQFAISQLGGTAAGAMSSLENFSRFMRESPGGEAWLRGFGIQTRDAKGQLRDRKELLDSFFASSRFTNEAYWAKLRDAQFIGIDEDTMRAGMNPERHAREAEARAKFRNAGFDPEKAAEAGKKFEQVWRSLGLSIDIIADKVAMAMAGPAGDKFRQLIEYLDRNSGRIADGLIVIGNAIIAAAGQLISWVAHVAEWEEMAEKWIAANPKIADGLKAITDALGPLGTALAALATGAALRGLIGLLSLSGLSGIAAFVAGGALAGAAALVGGAALGAMTGSAGEGDDEMQRRKNLEGDPDYYKPGHPGGQGDIGAGGRFRKALGGGGGGSASAVSRLQAMEAAMDQLDKEGVPKEHLRAAAALLVGQADMESGLDPNKSHDHGTGYGVYGARLSRRTGMLAWLDAHGYAANDLKGQMREMAHRAMTDYPQTRNRLMNATQESLDRDSWVITHNFESPLVDNDRTGATRRAYGSMPMRDGTLTASAPKSSFGLNGWIAAGGGYAHAAPAPAAPIGHSSVNSYDFGSNVINHKPTFVINGAGDPGATADAVAKKQGSLYSDALRNLQGAAR
jgi:hypothetical protein